MNDMQDTNIRLRSLPELIDERNSIKNRLNSLGLENQYVVKSTLKSASDAITANSIAFKEYMRAIYKEQQKKNNSFTYDDNNVTSATFDTISSHISDALSEASNSSIFERSDKLKIMKYIETSINNAKINEKEKKQLLEQYKYASDSLQNSTGLLDKTSALLTRSIGDFTGILGSVFSDLPPIFGWMMTRGGDMISSHLERRRTKKERLASLEYDISNAESDRDAHINSETGEIIKRPSLFDKQEQQNTNDNLSNIFNAKQSLMSSSLLSDERSSKLDRMKNETGSLLEGNPTGTESDPFYVVISNDRLNSKKDKAGSLNDLIGMLTNAFTLKGLIGGKSDLLNDAKSLLSRRRNANNCCCDDAMQDIDIDSRKKSKRERRRERKRKKRELLRRTTGSVLDNDSLKDIEFDIDTGAKEYKGDKKPGALKTKEVPSYGNKLSRTVRPTNSLIKSAVDTGADVLEHSSIGKSVLSKVISVGAKALPFVAKAGARFVPGAGQALLAKDVYDIGTLIYDKYNEAQDKLGGKLIDTITDGSLFNAIGKNFSLSGLFTGEVFDKAIDQLSKNIKEPTKQTTNNKITEAENNSPNIIDAINQPRMPLSDQLNTTELSRKQNEMINQERNIRLQHSSTNVQNINNVQNVNNTTQRIIKMTNPEAYNVNGSSR